MVQCRFCTQYHNLFINKRGSTSFSSWCPWYLNDTVHRCGPGGSMCACHAAGLGSISDWDKFPGWGFFRGFSSPVRQMSGSFRPQGPRISYGHHYHHHSSSFITGTNDLRCWRALKPQINLTQWYTSPSLDWTCFSRWLSSSSMASKVTWPNPTWLFLMGLC